MEVHRVVGDFERHLVWLPEGRRRLFRSSAPRSATTPAGAAAFLAVRGGLRGAATRCCSAPTW